MRVQPRSGRRAAGALLLLLVLAALLSSCPRRKPGTGSWTWEGRILSAASLEELGRGGRISPAALDDWLAYFGFPREGIEAEARYLEAGGTRLFFLSLEPPKARARVLLLHGYLAHAGHFAPLARSLLSRGFALDLLDLPGHGLSGGRPAAIGDFAEYGGAVAAALEALPVDGLPRFALGHSTGAAALWERLRVAGPGDFRALVFAAPLFRVARQDLYGLANAVAGKRSIALPRVNFASPGTIRNPAFLAFTQFADPFYPARYDPAWFRALEAWVHGQGEARALAGAPPLLMVQGEADDVVDWRYNLDWYGRAFPEHRIELFPELSHTILSERPEEAGPVFEEILAFLEEEMAPSSR
jgi:alpha-beta hydrolase superfamily lysophospholipase